ncbi:COG4705 family protein [Streptomyces sp. NPDC002092]
MTTDHLTSDRPVQPSRHGQHTGRVRHAASKVPEVTVYFWIIKVLTTGMGETASDWLAHVLGPIPAVGVGGVAFVAALVVQFAVRRYVAWIYWTAIVVVSVFGTMAADVLHVGLGVPYLISTPFFMVALAAVFVLWYRSEGTLSIHSIHTRRRETFYWAAVLATFALGTAAGDLTATIGLGYLGSAVVYAAAIAVPAVAHRWSGLNAVLAFWSAYVITRPLGASVADWMAMGHDRGGLALGLGPVTLSWTVAILGFVGYLAVSRTDVGEAAV